MPDDSALPDAGVQLPPPGWYPDPEHPRQRRYWNGDAWGESLQPIGFRPLLEFAGLMIAGVIAVVLEFKIFSSDSITPSLASCAGNSECRQVFCDALYDQAQSAIAPAVIPWLVLLALAIYATYVVSAEIRAHLGIGRFVLILGIIPAWIAVAIMFPPFMSLAAFDPCLY